TMVCAGSLFGAIHFVAWSSPSPSHAEMVLWQFSTTAVVIGLFLGGNHIIFLGLIYLFMSYIVARIILIILAFLQLRSLPLAAFCTIQWTTYIPHI
ncbi:hypothetical protein EDD18DRAFT_1089669, partial [Armillaria luteobubalina]